MTYQEPHTPTPNGAFLDYVDAVPPTPCADHRPAVKRDIIDLYPEPRPKRFGGLDTNTLMATRYPPLKWIVPGYVPQGFSVLAGRQKLGKTWLAMDWALAVATGGVAMGSVDVDPGDVLYIDMENGPQLIQERIRALYPHGDVPDLSRLSWETEAPELGEDFFEGLDGWRESVSNPRLVVIDVLQRVKPAGVSTRNSYENDYSIWAPLQRWAAEHGIAVVGLHHTRKGGADDPLEALSGSNGLSACADTTLVLDRDSSGVTLYVRGRRVREVESAMSFVAGAWSITGDAAEVRRSDERGNILVTLEQATEPLSPTELADVTGMKNGNIRKLLFVMAKAGEVQRIGRGRYIHPANQHLNPEHSTPGNNGNIGNIALEAGDDET